MNINDLRNMVLVGMGYAILFVLMEYTLTQVRKQLAQYGIMVSSRDGEYGVYVKGYSDKKYFTYDLEDALQTGLAVVNKEYTI